MAKDKAEEREPTRRLVLKREQVIVLPEGVELADEKKLAEALGLKSARGLVTREAWTTIAEFEGGSMEQAILSYTGPAGEPDSKVGVFKAPTVRSWAGGLELVAPPKPLVQKRAID